LATHRLVPFARWITPEAESRRFDARFFLIEMPAGQIARADERETTLSFWDGPAAVLERAARGEFFLAPPTSRALELRAEVPSVAAAVAVAERQSLLPICPVFVAGDPPFIALPGDPMHPVRERRVDGVTRYAMRDGRIVAEAAPEESPR
ncbi:MAG TPA: hypothetical protein VHB21_22780, partial [Minicystis sp.]|nr:hypothetical protein [Minicystis sp.]